MKCTVLEARKYIYRIRNLDKREYAIRYWAFLRGNGTEPEHACSSMAAQAVRMELHAIAYPETRN